MAAAVRAQLWLNLLFPSRLPLRLREDMRDSLPPPFVPWAPCFVWPEQGPLPGEAVG